MKHSTFTRTTAETTQPFVNWVYFLQKSRLLKSCPCCSGPLQTNEVIHHNASSPILVCDQCSDTHFETTNWFVYEDYQQSCSIYGNQWIYSNHK